MSDLYVEKKAEGSLKSFNKRIVYKADTELSKKKYANLVDFNFGEKFFYGKVQRDFVPMYFDGDGIELKALSTSVTDGQYFSVMGFVADAFERLALQFSKAVSDNKIYGNEKYLSRLKVYKAYSSPITVFNEHFITLTDALVAKIRGDEVDIDNFDDFLLHFKKYVLKSSDEIPFTFPAFLKSKYCPMTVSGLVIEIADLEYHNDDQKIKMFYNNRNWDYFLNACRSYGFMVDKNIPWRLVADISSQPMLEIAAAYDLGHTDLILNTGFSRPEIFFLQDFRQYLLNVYNRVIDDEVVKLKQCRNSLIVDYKKSERYTLEQIFEKLNDADLLKLYAEIRFKEDPKHFTNEKKSSIMRECMDILDTSGGPRSLRVFEKIINQPFDYRGSVSYLYKQGEKGFGEKIVLSEPR
tara:strand:+ start:22798 stop:24024 length:1227 start_codon:yes stop_codon:yes gene_type:complete